MTSYLELKRKAEEMMAEAEHLRQMEIAAIIEEIKSKIAEYGLTAQDLGMSAKGRRGRPPKSAAAKKPGRKPAAKKTRAKKGKAATKSVVKYRGPNGETWSGGRGRKPAWVMAVLKSGKSIEDYAV